jgi:hypothetical protein
MYLYVDREKDTSGGETYEHRDNTSSAQFRSHACDYNTRYLLRSYPS